MPGLGPTSGSVVNVASGTIIDRQELESVCQKLNIKLVPAEGPHTTPMDLDAAFQGNWQMDHVQAVIVLVDALFFQRRKSGSPRLYCCRARLPAIYGFRDHVDAGRPLSVYGGSTCLENFHRGGPPMVGKILKGAKTRRSSCRISPPSSN